MKIILKESLNVKEMDFIKELVKKDLARGHYKADLDKLYLQLDRINNKNIVDVSAPPNHITNEAHLYLVKDLDDRVGCVSLVNRDFGIDKKICEIYILSLNDNHKRSGYGSAILDKIEHKFEKDYFLFARCLGKSNSMKKLLLKHDFTALPVDKTDSDTQSFIKY